MQITAPSVDSDYYSEEKRWRRDLWAFLSGLIRHWSAFTGIFVSGTLPAYIVYLLHMTSGLPGWVFAASGAAGLIVAAFLVFRDEQITIDKSLAKIQSMTENQKAIELEISELRAKLDDKKRRKEIQDRLGEFHLQIRKRLREIERMSAYAFAAKYEDDLKKDQSDKDSTALMLEVVNYIETFSESSKAIFLDDSDFQFSCDPPRPSDVLGRQAVFRHRMIDYIKHRSVQLMKVIDSIPSLPL